MMFAAKSILYFYKVKPYLLKMIAEIKIDIKLGDWDWMVWMCGLGAFFRGGGI